jgi:hypothetical protein
MATCYRPLRGLGTTSLKPSISWYGLCLFAVAAFAARFFGGSAYHGLTPLPTCYRPLRGLGTTSFKPSISWYGLCLFAVAAFAASLILVCPIPWARAQRYLLPPAPRAGNDVIQTVDFLVRAMPVCCRRVRGFPWFGMPPTLGSRRGWG